MNLYHRIAEVRNNIDRLQETANKHKTNGKIRCHKLICQVIDENRAHLDELNQDLIKHNRIILYRLHHE